MKLLRLDLTAYGHFAGFSLDLDTSAGLHLVFGPNEAGKSTTLRALHALLFGFERSTSDGFRFHYNKLRVGGLMVDGAGRRLECVRRKGNANTLRDARDQDPLDEERLTRMLGGVNRDLFVRMFGIDHPTLVRGGMELLSSRGDLGRALFSGAGYASGAKLLKQLGEEAQGLFKESSRATLPKINRVQREWSEARETLRQSMTPSTAWTQQDERHQTALSRRQAVEASLQALEIQRECWLRRRDDLPALATYRQLEREWQGLQHVPALPKNFATQVERARSARLSAERDGQKARDRLAALQRDANSHLPDEGILQAAERIEALKESLGSFRQARSDLPARQSELALHESSAAELLQKLRPGAVLADAEQWRLADSDRLRLTRLSRQHGGLAAACEQQTARLQTLERELAEVETRLGQAPPAAQLARLRQMGPRLIAAREQAHELAARRQRLRQREKQALQRGAELGLPDDAWRTVDPTSLPTTAAVEEFRERMAENARALQLVAREVQQHEASLRAIGQDLQALERDRPIPSEPALAAARADRQAGWDLIRRSWLAARDVGAEQAYCQRWKTGEDLAAAYELAVQAADQIADQLREMAEQVERKSQLLAASRSQQALLDQARQRQQALAASGQELSAAWVALWQPLGVEAREPRQMLHWLDQYQGLADSAQEFRAEHAAFAEATRRLLALRSETEQALPEMARAEDRSAPQMRQPVAAADDVLVSFPQWVRDFEETLRKLEERERTLAGWGRDRSRLEQEVPRARQVLEQSRFELAAWEREWGEAVATLGMPAASRPEEVDFVLERSAALFQHLSHADEKRRRIELIEKHLTTFTQEVQSLCAVAATDLAAVDPESAAMELFERLKRSRQAEQTLRELQKSRVQLEKQVADLGATAAKARCEMTRLMDEAGVTEEQQLCAVVEQADRREQLAQALALRDEEWTRRAGPQSREEFLRQVADLSAESVAAELAQLDAQIARLHQEREQAIEQCAAAKNELQRLDGSARAAEAAQAAQELLAELGRHTVDYARIRLAACVLERAIERYRDRHQEPLLDRASRLFAALTCGTYSHLHAVDEQGQIVLHGVRPNGEEVPVEHMSSGAADQVYLALRLAYVEKHAAEQTPLPFIVDDILVQFDDERAAAALRVFGELSRKTQVIFFTHHAHLIDLARQHLAEDDFVVHHLSTSSLLPAR